MTVPALNNRLGKTALWVHLGGVFVGGTMIGTSTLLNFKGDEQEIVQGVGTLIFLVMAGWSMVLAARGLGEGERAPLPLGILITGIFEITGLMFGLGIYTATHQEDGRDSIPYINAYALPVFVPLILYCLILAALVGRPKVLPSNIRTPWNLKRMILTFCASLVLVLPYPLLKFCAKLQRAKWQGDLAERLLYYSPTLFEELAPADKFMYKRYHAFDTIEEGRPSQEEFSKAAVFSAKSSNASLRLGMLLILYANNLTRDAQEEVFLNYAQDSDPVILGASFRVLLDGNAVKTTYWIKKRSSKIVRQLLSMTHHIRNVVVRQAVVTLSQFFDIEIQHIMNHKHFRSTQGQVTYLMSALDAEETAELESIRQKAEAWLKEQP